MSASVSGALSCLWGVTKTFASCLPNDENSRITGLQKKMNVLREETSAHACS